MLQSGYLVIDPQTKELVDTLVVPWSFSDASALKDKTKGYILVSLRDWQDEGIYEVTKWKEVYLTDPSQVPNTLGKVWFEYFKWVKDTDGISRRKRIPRAKKDIVRTPEEHTLWNTFVTCEHCKRKVRLGLYNNRHGKKCRNKKRWYTIAEIDQMKKGPSV